MNCLTRIHVRHTLNDALNEVITDEWYLFFLYLFNRNYPESQVILMREMCEFDVRVTVKQYIIIMTMTRYIRFTKHVEAL